MKLCGIVAAVKWRLVGCLFFLVSSLVGCTVWGQRPVTKWTDATGGEQLERLFWTEVKNKNWVEIETHVSATFVSLTTAGSKTRETDLDRLKQFDLQDFSIGDVDTQPNGPDLTVSYTLVLHGTVGGKPLPGTPVRGMTIWQHGDHGWIAIAHSSVPVLPTP